MHLAGRRSKEIEDEDLLAASDKTWVLSEPYSNYCTVPNREYSCGPSEAMSHLAD